MKQQCPDCRFDGETKTQVCRPCMSKIHIIDLPRVLAHQDRLKLKYSHIEREINKSDLPASKEFLEGIGYEVKNSRTLRNQRQSENKEENYYEIERRRTQI